MQISRNLQPDACESHAPDAKILLLLVSTLAFAAVLSGCASPGPPLPPSLNLPQLAAGVTGARSGDQVTLRWTTPSRTTDRMLIRQPITARICRDLGRSRRQPAPCTQVAELRVSPGESQATDILPPPLASGAPRLLAYRVLLLNAAGHSAGPAGPVFVAAGSAPAEVAGLHASSTKTGVLLQWTPQPDAAQDWIEVDRTLTSAPPRPKPATKQPNQPLSQLGTQEASADVRLRPGAQNGDAGGMLDTTAQIGNAYTYSAQRVRSVEIGGQKLEVRSQLAGPVGILVRDNFPPDAPTGLVASPGFAPAAQNQPPKPTIDLSWIPNDEPRLAGYRIYRREPNGAWKLLTPQLVRAASFSDADVAPGQQFTYRVTAVSDAGVESPTSNEVEETAPAP